MFDPIYYLLVREGYFHIFVIYRKDLMISDRFVEFINNNVVAYTLGTRNAKLEPWVGKPRGVTISDDRKSFTMLIPEVAIECHLENMENNGEVSLNIVSIPKFESYQFKGTYTSNAPCTDEEVQVIKDWKTKFCEGCEVIGYPEQLIRSMDLQILEPAIAITFEVKEIFEQTPKPGTGNKIS